MDNVEYWVPVELYSDLRARLEQLEAENEVLREQNFAMNKTTVEQEKRLNKRTGSTAIYLPAIDARIIEELSGTNLIVEKRGGWDWTQTAVDFVCILNDTNRAKGASDG